MAGIHFFDPEGILSLRENGYRDTAMALAELIDNSIQAEAKNIRIILVERIREGKRRTWNVDEVLIVDDGNGMDKETTRDCLRFGGGTRHGAKKGLGKFGFGLPNSSASQCPRFEVYTWKDPKHIFHNYFDFNEIYEERTEFLPDVQELEKLPSEFTQIGINPSKDNTVIQWKNCDRLNYKTGGRLATHIGKPVGRIFRHFINDNEIKINIDVYQDNGTKWTKKRGECFTVKPLDPMFLMTDTQLPEPYNERATNVVHPEEKSETEYYTVSETEETEDGNIEHEVKVKFSRVEDRDNIHGSSELGQIYRSMQGVSVVRAGREIALDSFGFITDVSDPKNRWWSVEVKFEPVSDHLFGLDNSKQNVFNFKNVQNKDAMDVINDEDSPVAFRLMHKISKLINPNVKAMKEEIDEMKRGSRKKDKPKKDAGELPEKLEPVRVPPKNGKKKKTEIKDEDYEKTKEWILNRYPSYSKEPDKLDLALEWFFQKNPFEQFIVFSQLGDTDLLSYTQLGDKTIIEINRNHEFYDRFIVPIFNSEDYSKIDPLLILFGAMVHSEIDMSRDDNVLQFFRSRLGFNLNLYINEWSQS